MIVSFFYWFRIYNNFSILRFSMHFGVDQHAISPWLNAVARPYSAGQLTFDSQLNCFYIYSDIRNQCQLADKELTRTMQSLVDVKLLMKSPKEVFIHVISSHYWRIIIFQYYALGVAIRIEHCLDIDKNLLCYLKGPNHSQNSLLEFWIW